MFNYYSFLICVHPTQVDIYYCGMPLGKIENGQFIIHEFLNPDTTKRTLTLQDLPNPCPFNSIDELKIAIHSFVDQIHMVDKP